MQCCILIFSELHRSGAALVPDCLSGTAPTAASLDVTSPSDDVLNNLTPNFDEYTDINVPQPRLVVAGFHQGWER